MTLIILLLVIFALVCAIFALAHVAPNINWTAVGLLLLAIVHLAGFLTTRV